jgi:hypothetical protein
MAVDGEGVDDMNLGESPTRKNEVELGGVQE